MSKEMETAFNFSDARTRAFWLDVLNSGLHHGERYGNKEYRYINASNNSSRLSIEVDSSARTVLQILENVATKYKALQKLNEIREINNRTPTDSYYTNVHLLKTKELDEAEEKLKEEITKKEQRLLEIYNEYVTRRFLDEIVEAYNLDVIEYNERLESD